MTTHNNNEFQSFTKTRWEWNEETDEWVQVTETFGREVTGEWNRSESGEWTGWSTERRWDRNEDGEWQERSR